MSVARFFATATGRWLRAVLGAVLVVFGFLGAPWWVPSLGVVFIIVAALNVCALAVLFGGPFNGRKARAPV